MNRKWIGMILVFKLLLLALSPISIFAQAETPRYGGTIVVGTTSDPQTLNSALHTSSVEHIVDSKIFEALIWFDLDYTPQPRLAESWTISPDGLTYTFNLIRNATWHDGEPFTSADVKFSFEEVLMKYNPAGKIYFEVIETVETPDPYTAVLKLSKPFPSLIFFLSPMYASIVPKHIYEGTDIMNNPRNFEDPVGTGPFIFEKWVKGDHITLVRNPNYYRKGQPYLDKVVYKIIPDPTMMVVTLINGEIDYLPLYLRADDVDRIKETANLVFHPGSASGGPAYQMLINLRNQYLKNLKVRQAIAHALDKETINEKASFGHYRVANSFVHQDILWAYDPDVPKYEYNLEKANALLDEAGYPIGAGNKRFELSITYNRGWSEAVKQAEVIKEQLKDVNIEVTLKPYDGPTIADRVYNAWNFDLFIEGFATGPDPFLLCARYLSSKTIEARTVRSNAMGYKNNRADELFEMGLSETDEDKRVQYVHELQKTVLEDLPVIPVIDITQPSAYRDEFVNLGIDATGRENFATAYWKKGANISPEAAMEAIQTAEEEIDKLRKSYYDVTKAKEQIEAAKEAYNQGDYMTASSMAKDAVQLAKPPYLLYGGIAAIIVIAVAAVLLLKKRGP